MHKNLLYLKLILLLLFCWIGVAQSSGQFLIAQVDRGIVPQTSVRSGWLPVRLVFEYHGSNYTVRLQVKSKEFNRYTQEMARSPRPSNLVARLKLAQKGAKDIAPLTAALKRAAPNRSKEKLAAFALSFVQSLPYKNDALTTPYDEAWRAPLQTLVDREIDCEDSSILYSSLLLGFGINNALVIVPGHMLAAVSGNFSGDYLRHQGKKYYFAETTDTGWIIGKSPKNYSSAKILPVSAMSQSSPSPSVHSLNNGGESSTVEPKPSSSNGLPIFLFSFLIIGTGLFMVWKWWDEQKPVHDPDSSWDDDFDDDPYKDYNDS
jgi:hypothetical protein